MIQVTGSVYLPLITMNSRRLLALLQALLVLIVIALGWTYIMNAMRKQFRLTQSSIGYKMWSELPVPISMEFYLFDWVNAEEFAANPSAVKPRFEEVGPFVYTEEHKRVDVSWSEDGSTISYNQTRTWHFVPEKSENLSSPVTNVNGIALVRFGTGLSSASSFTTRTMHYYSRPLPT